MKKELKYLAINHIIKYALMVLYIITIVFVALESFVAVGVLGFFMICGLIASIVFDVMFIGGALRNDK